MPCYDGRDRPEEVRKDAIHNSPVAEMLCSVIKILIAEHRVVPDVPGLAQWWVEHQRRDAARRADALIVPHPLVALRLVERRAEGDVVEATFQEGDQTHTCTSSDPDQIRRWYAIAQRGGR